MKCITCKHFAFENIGGGKGAEAQPTKLAILGMGRCAFVKEAWIHMSANYERECDRYAPAGKKLAQARIDWLNEQINERKEQK